MSLPSDPLEAFSCLSLFPRTFASFPNPPPPFNPDDLQESHDFLKSMPFERSDKLIEQAKAIVDDSSELLNVDMLSSDAEVMENPRERRPALGRRRPRFSLKPNSSLPTANLEPSLDMDKLKDPEEFFVAFERAENAKREIEKQTGNVLMDLDQDIQSMATRPRRPGIVRSDRRSVKYKHRYSTASSPVETFEEEIPCPLCNSQEEKSDSNVELQEKELSVAKAENKVNELLDHLLTSTCDGDEAVSLLQERLQIKPIDLEKINLPDLQDIRRIDLKVSRENLARPRNSLSDIQSLMKGISKRTPKQKAKRSVDQLASPTPPRSPLASISSLKKQILQCDVLSDPFSADDAYQSPVRNASHIESNSKQPDQVDAEKEQSVSENNDRRTPQQQPESSAHKLASPTPPRNPFASISLQTKQMLQSDPECDPFSTANIDSGINVVSSGSQASLENISLRRPETESDSHTIKPNEYNGRVEDIPPEAVISTQIQVNVEGPTIDNSGAIQKESDESNPAIDEDQSTNGSLKAAESGEQLHEKQNKGGKIKAQPYNKRKRKAASRRQSLAGSGTTFDAQGRRRSTRIRSRPLEFWKGERFLYGRVHSSLATVIGIKYESPGKSDGVNPTLKVKSFVSDEHKELLEQAARF